jgi:hypothetical protein
VLPSDIRIAFPAPQRPFLSSSPSQLHKRHLGSQHRQRADPTGLEPRDDEVARGEPADRPALPSAAELHLLAETPRVPSRKYGITSEDEAYTEGMFFGSQLPIVEWWLTLDSLPPKIERPATSNHAGTFSAVP